MVYKHYGNSKLTPNEKENYSNIKHFFKKLRDDKLGLLKMLPKHLSAFIIYHFFLKNKTDLYIGNNSTEYFYGLYNCTPCNERCVELGFAKKFIKKSESPILEIGNVIRRYIISDKLITIDKYEKYPRVLNYDFINSLDEYKKFLPPKFNLISLSTFEHIGWDEKIDKNSFAKIFETLDKLHKLGLSSVLITIPLGWNPAIDYFLAFNLIPEKYKVIYFYKKNFRWYKRFYYPREYSFYNFKKKSANSIAIIINNW